MRLLPFATMTFALLLSGCASDTHESLAAREIDLLQEMLTLLREVDDPAAAETAGRRLTEIDAELGELRARRARLDTPTDEQSRALEYQFGERRRALAMELVGERLRVELDPRLADVVDLPVARLD